MVLQQRDYIALMFSSENVWNYLTSGRWTDRGSRDFHISLLRGYLHSALQGALSAASDEIRSAFDTDDEENHENYRILREAMPELECADGLRLRDYISCAISGLEKLRGDEELGPDESKGLFRLCINLSIASKSKTIAALSLVG